MERKKPTRLLFGFILGVSIIQIYKGYLNSEVVLSAFGIAVISLIGIGSSKSEVTNENKKH